MKLQNVIIPYTAITLSNRYADKGLFFAFDELDNLIGIVLYNSEKDCYYLQTVTNSWITLDNGISGETLEDFYDRLQKEYKQPYLMYTKTAI